MRDLLIDVKECTGCHVCEIICSYHHKKVFNRRISSIEVERDGAENLFRIFLHKRPINSRYPCDICMDCANYCTVGALKIVEV